jgi:hypothetical protein
VRLDHNEVAGADELVVYETVWSRWRADRGPCPGAVAQGPETLQDPAAEKAGARIIASRYP